MTNYVDVAEANVKKMFETYNQDRDAFMSQLRTILDFMNQVYNKIQFYKGVEEDTQLSDEIYEDLLYTKVRIIYQARNENTYKLLKALDLVSRVDVAINSRKVIDFIKAHRYLEAVVAYSKYYSEEAKVMNRGRR